MKAKRKPRSNRVASNDGLGKLRPYTSAEIRAIRKDYTMGCVIDNNRLKEAGMKYRYTVDGCTYYLPND